MMPSCASDGQMVDSNWLCNQDDHPANCCCGSIAEVSIENKIEQAMDLVKNHLMFAVREEMKILNDEIQELTEKNEELEFENQFLRSYAKPETLARLDAFNYSDS